MSVTIGFTCTEEVATGIVNVQSLMKLTVVRKRCPVCEAEVESLRQHCEEMADDEHVVAGVLET